MTTEQPTTPPVVHSTALLGAVPESSIFKCPVCASHYFGPIYEKNRHIGRYCKGWPSGFDRSYLSCREKHEERFSEQPAAHTMSADIPPTLQAFDYPSGMTVAELKAMVRDWPEANQYGEPCEVWLCDSAGLSNQARMATPLNMRQNEDGTKLWADLMLGHTA